MYTFEGIGVKGGSREVTGYREQVTAEKATGHSRSNGRGKPKPQSQAREGKPFGRESTRKDANQKTTEATEELRGRPQENQDRTAKAKTLLAADAREGTNTPNSV